MHEIWIAIAVGIIGNGAISWRTLAVLKVELRWIKVELARHESDIKYIQRGRGKR